MKDTVMPKIVYLCGSIKFWMKLDSINVQETIAGNICLTSAVYTHLGPVLLDSSQKEKLAELNKHKIDLADEVLVVNTEGYIGDSTISEIKYALESGKPIRWLEQMITIDAIEMWDVDTYIESLIND